MKVLMIQPPSVPEWSRHIFAYEPLALEYVGAGLKPDGHDVHVVDARFDPDVEAKFRQWQPNLGQLMLSGARVPHPVTRHPARQDPTRAAAREQTLLLTPTRAMVFWQYDRARSATR